MSYLDPPILTFYPTLPPSSLTYYTTSHPHTPHTLTHHTPSLTTHLHTLSPQIAAYEAELERLLHLQQLQELMDPEDPELQLTLEEAGVNGASSEALSQAIDNVQSSLESEQQKLATLLKNLAGEVRGRGGRREERK